ncbi:MAG: catecholate siderophore receptor [Hyphomicrobiales bacterium]|jgi:catecholate siderophore receptor
MAGIKAPLSRRFQRIATLKIALLSVSYVALSMAASVGASAQNPVAQAPAEGTQLPPVRIDEPNRKPRRKQAEQRSRANTPARTARRNAPRQTAQPAPAAPAGKADTQDTRTGTVGVYANSTSVATKTNTPLINIPQSVSVLTKDFIKDQGFQSIDDAVRYVPGVVPHQGEGNRDELVIRGVDSSANFFVNGFRDDVQFFRDLYNTQSIEILKGPSALIFGRGAGGGLLNRTLKEADWKTIREVTAQTGSWFDRRIAVDVGQGINENVAARFNAFYEASDTFRDYGHLERYGLNPTFSFRPSDDTKIKVSYEYYHDERLADRGNPSQSITGVPVTAANAAFARANPASPFVSNFATFFGSPNYNGTHADVNTGMAFIEHDFGNGLSVKNSSMFASYLRGYRNVYPGNGALSGAVNPADTSMNLAAYQNTTNRNNLFNQTDFTYKVETGPARHTLTFGTEFGLQAGLAHRDTGFFPTNGGANTIAVNPFSPTYFGPVVFNHIATDAASRSDLYTQSGYVQDQIELTRYLQLIAGVRYDRFDFTAFDENTSTTRSRVDEKVSPRAAIIVKPIENLSVYASYAISYLPASGDQFTQLNNGTLILEPQKFDNKEIGVKWNILPRLQYSAAIYQLDRTNVPIADPNNAGFFLLSGSHRIRGFETELKGYVTADWQSSLGYAYTDARITSDTTTTIVAGNRVQLVPFHQFSLWNKYQFTPMWSAALGVIYFSDSFASSDDTVKLPGFVRVDAAVYARINETWKAQINVENIFNEGYWATADGNNNLSPGQSRTVRLTATANF